MAWTYDNGNRVANLYIVNTPETATPLAVLADYLERLLPTVDIIAMDCNGHHPTWSLNLPLGHDGASRGRTVHAVLADAQWRFPPQRYFSRPASKTAPDLIACAPHLVFMHFEAFTEAAIDSDHIPLFARIAPPTALAHVWPTVEQPCTAPTLRRLVHKATATQRAAFTAAAERRFARYNRSIRNRTVSVQHAAIVGILLRSLDEHIPAASIRNPKPFTNHRIEQAQRRYAALLREPATLEEDLASARDLILQLTQQLAEQRLGLENLTASSSPWTAYKRYTSTPSQAATAPTATELAAFYERLQAAKVPEAPQDARLPQERDPFTPAELDWGIKRDPRKRSADRTGLSPYILPWLGPEARSAILKLFNSCLETSTCPHEWRRSRTCPLLKPDKNPAEVAAYRPVVLTSVFSRLFERLMLRRLVPMVPLHSSQHGFRPGRSPEFALTHLMEDIVDGLRAQHHHVQHRQLLTLIDFSSAFPSMPHQPLLRKARQKGIPGLYLNWISYWLSDRTSSVRIGTDRPVAFSTKWGCPQGSLLGPFLWLIFIDDLLVQLDQHRRAWELQNPTVRRIGTSANPVTPRVHVVDFACVADDLTIWATSPTLADAAEHTRCFAQIVGEWALANHIDVSPKSSALAILGRSPAAVVHGVAPLQLSPDGRIPPVPVVCTQANMAADQDHLNVARILGIRFDSAGHFTSHARYLVATLRPLLGHMQALQAYHMRPGMLHQLWRGAGESRLLYGCTIWWPLLSAESRTALSAIQIAAARIITGCSRTAASDAVLLEAGLQPLEHLVEIHMRKLHQRIYRTQPSRASAALTRGTWTVPADAAGWVSPRQLYAPRVEMVGVRPTPLRDTQWNPSGSDLQTLSKVRFLYADAIPGVVATDPPERRLEANLAQQNRARAIAPAAAWLWTDGSVIQPSPDAPHPRAAAAYILHHPRAAPLQDGQHCHPDSCSYATEVAAGILGLTAVTATPALFTGLDIVWATDSLSVISSLARGPDSPPQYETSKLFQLLIQIAAFARSVTVAFFFSHCNFAPQDAVDELARASALSPPPRNVRLLPVTARDAAQAAIRTLRAAQPAIQHGTRSRLPVILSVRPSALFHAELPLRDERLLLRLRVGVSKEVGGHLHGVPFTCSLCRDPTDLSRRSGAAVSHIFTCAAFEAQRAAYGVTLSDLWQRAALAVRYVRDFLQARDAVHQL